MKTIVLLCPLILLFILFSDPGTFASASNSMKPGDTERDALSKAEFLVGEWVGEGWSLTDSGERQKFWIEESYRYRGNKDLMDMEGRFGDMMPDGTRSPDQQYALGILFYDAASSEYRMWHYSNGTAFTVRIDVDPKARTAQYKRANAKGQTTRFTLAVGEDGVWVSRIDILRPDNTWLQVMEFRMTRAAMKQVEGR